MSQARAARQAFLAVTLLAAGNVCSAGGLLGIDHRWSYDNSGIWKRSNQTALLYAMVAGEAAGALWEGGETRLGKTFWQSIDSSAASALSAEVLKRVTTRERPTETDNPGKWFQGDSHHSFPSGEVAVVSAIVTPFVIEYRSDHPAVYALEVLPVYDAIARMKVQAHWQTDVIAGFALGTAAGYFAHTRNKPFILSVLPHGFMVGLHKSW
jgi:hypothetical protein